MNTDSRLSYYILFAVSFIAAVWFFVDYPSQDPRSAAKISFSKDEIQQRANQQLTDLGFSIDNYSVGNVSYNSDRELLDSLQYQLGRKQAIEILKAGGLSNVKPFYWNVTFNRKGVGSGAGGNGGPPSDPNPKELRLHFDVDGQFIALENPSEHLPQNRVQRAALTSVFRPPAGGSGKAVMTAESDSLLDRLLYFDMQKEQGAYANHQQKIEKGVRDNFKRGIPYRHSRNDARALAVYHLTETGWDTASFQYDTVFVNRIGTINAANVRYAAADSIPGRPLIVDVTVAPGGALLQLNADYSADENDEERTSDFIGEILYVVLIFGLGITALFIFFFRIRGRAIDTKSALIAAILMGVIIPAYIFLAQVGETRLLSGDASANEIIVLLLQMGITGAVASVGFFILFAISDSITRQHWPERLASYDYLRQGMFFNKPIGIAVLNSIGLAFVLAGFWTVLLELFPHLYLSTNDVFLTGEAAWAPLFLLLDGSWFSFLTILTAFLAIAGIAYGYGNNYWMAGLFSIAACGIFVPVDGSLGPPLHNFLAGAAFGAVLFFIYIKWDFLTLLITHFLFLGLMGSSTGWTVANSPDIYTFLLFTGVLVVLAVAGGAAVAMGKEERSLPQYVPGYVEELAQEERIKQELQIAREVQQSFLPLRIPVIAGLNVAAACQPAYETGGDYYDFIRLDDHRVAIAIGDVSGKGIQAAFYMTFVKGMLHSLCRETDSPAEVLCKANRLFCDNAAKGTFISLIYGIIDTEERTFTFARAGHNPILHAKHSSERIEELQPSGLGIGLTKGEMFDNKIQEIKLSITEDDLFLLYTDGIVEAQNQSHQFYGTKKLKKLIQEKKQKPAAKIVSAISEGVSRFIGKAKQHDDMTLMAIRFVDQNH
jgi:hypothetical protein